MIDKSSIGFVIGACGVAACVALALVMHILNPYLPAIRGFLLWMCDPRAVIGMALGMVVMAGIAVCALADMEGEA